MNASRHSSPFQINSCIFEVFEIVCGSTGAMDTSCRAAQTEKINHLTVHHQTFVFGVAFCDPTGLSRLAGTSGTQGRFALRCGIDFCVPTKLSCLAEPSGTQGRFALGCDIEFCEPTGLGCLTEPYGTQGRFDLRCDIDFCELTGHERLAGSSGTLDKFAPGCDLFFCELTGLERLVRSSGTQGRFALRCDIDFCECSMRLESQEIFHSQSDHIGIFWSLPSFVFSQEVDLILMIEQLCCEYLRQRSGLQQDDLPSQMSYRLSANKHLFCKRKSRLRLNDTEYLRRERRYSVFVDDNRAVHGNFRQGYVGSPWADPNFHHYGRCRIVSAIFLNVC